MKNRLRKVLSLMLVVLIIESVAASLGWVAASAENSVSIKSMYDKNNIAPGMIIVCLNEPFYGDITELLPEVDIIDYNDIYLSVVDVVQKIKGEIKKSITDRIGTTFTVTLAECSVDAVFSAIEALEANEYIKYAEPNQYGDIETIPNDLLFNYPTAIPQWGLLKVDAPEAWDYLTGIDATEGSLTYECIKVAVLDTGVYDEHEDLVGNLDMSLAYNAYDQIAGNTEDNSGHGTSVSGIIGAVGNNEIGVVGVCWKASIVPVKITSQSVFDTSTTMDVITRGIVYVDSLDIPIANLSCSLAYDTALLSAIEDYSDNGGLLIKSAGNNGVDIDSDSVFQALDAIDGVIIVGALAYDMEDDVKKSNSNYGDTVVDLFAPGETIRTTSLENHYFYESGTSMAVPFVTGTAALIKSANNSLSNTDIKDAIVNNVATSSSLTNYCSSGGRLSIPDALCSLGYQVIVSDTMTGGTANISAIFSETNETVFITVAPDPGYMLKPGTLKYNSSYPTLIYGKNYYFSMPATDTTITAQFYMVGDIDFDGYVTISDSLLALRHYAGSITLTGDAFLAADVDGDNDVDYDDAQYIANYSAGVITVFPIEV